MKNLISTTGIAIILAGASLAATAAPKTVILAIPSMDCPVCPVTVKRPCRKYPALARPM